MSDRVRQFYEKVPYQGGIHPRSHPSTLGAIGRLHGVACRGPEGARVLEIGCSRGENLLAIAREWPGAECVGIDVAASGIAEAWKRGREVVNARFHCLDVRDFDPGEKLYDYILCHGVFSWVEDGVKEAILKLCARALAPDGVAYISYNTYPGWLYREALRELILSNPTESPDRQREEAAALFDVLEAALESRTDPYGVFFRQEVARCRMKVRTILSHDELGPVNDPCYFLQFVEWAEEHGLSWVADSPLSTSLLPGTLPEKARENLRRLAPNRLYFEQMTDLLVNRTFRGSVLCRTGRMGPPRFRLLEGLFFRTSLRAVEETLDFNSETPAVFGAGAHRLTVSDPVFKSLLYVLQAGMQPYETLREHVTEQESPWEKTVIQFLRELVARGVGEAVLVR